MSGELSISGPTHLAIRLAQTLEATCLIRTPLQFIAWAERDLRQLIPHQLLVCGYIESGQTGLSTRTLIRHEYERLMAPKTPYLDEAQLLSSLARRWARRARPQVFRRRPENGSSGTERLPMLPAPIMVHGLPNIDGQGASYVALCGVEDSAIPRSVKLLELIVPHAHLALTALLRRQRSKPTADGSVTPPTTPGVAMPRVSQREREVMQWLQEGKTNWEIAQILGKSEHTIKNQVRSLLVKLRVNNRAQAVAKMAGMEMA